MFSLGGRKQEGEKMNKLLKKIAAVSLSAVLMLGLVSCNNATKGESDNSSKESV